MNSSKISLSETLGMIKNFRIEVLFKLILDLKCCPGFGKKIDQNSILTYFIQFFISLSGSLCHVFFCLYFLPAHVFLKDSTAMLDIFCSYFKFTI